MCYHLLGQRNHLKFLFSQGNAGFLGKFLKIKPERQVLPSTYYILPADGLWLTYLERCILYFSYILISAGS